MVALPPLADALGDHVHGDVRVGERREDAVADARPVGHAFEHEPGLVRGQGRAARPGTRVIQSASGTIQVPSASERALRTMSGTSNFLANSIDRECMTPAPMLAISSISS